MAEHDGRFPFPTTFIDRSLSAMNGCKAKGGENPELQVTDHGSGFTQAGRGTKKLHRMALEWGELNLFSLFEIGACTPPNIFSSAYGKPNYEAKVGRLLPRN